MPTRGDVLAVRTYRARPPPLHDNHVKTRTEHSLLLMRLEFKPRRPSEHVLYQILDHEAMGIANFRCPDTREKPRLAVCSKVAPEDLGECKAKRGKTAVLVGLTQALNVVLPL